MRKKIRAMRKSGGMRLATFAAICVLGGGCASSPTIGKLDPAPSHKRQPISVAGDRKSVV